MPEDEKVGLKEWKRETVWALGIWNRENILLAFAYFFYLINVIVALVILEIIYFTIYFSI